MALSKKRLFDEEYASLDLIAQPCKSAKIHGILADVSPMKTGKSKYFTGTIADANTSLRFVGFDTTQQRNLDTLYSKQQAVTFENCQIQKSRYGDDMEVVLKQTTKVANSPLKIAKPEIISSNTMSIAEIQQVRNGQAVTVAAKVLKVQEKSEVKPNLFKQDVTVSDSTGTIRVTLWQDDVDKLVLDKCYKMEKLIMQSFKGEKYLSPPKQSGSSIIQIDDIGTVEDLEEPEEDDENEIQDAEVVGVSHISSNSMCISCSGKVEGTTGMIGQCTKCSTVQRLDRCKKQLCCKVVLRNDNGQSKDLNVFLPMMRKIISNETITDEDEIEEVVTKLLMAEKFTARYSASNTVIAVSRKLNS